MTTYNLTKNDTPKFISCSKKGTPKNGTSRTSIYGSYPPGEKMKFSQWLRKTLTIKEYYLAISQKKISSNSELGVPRYSHSKFDEMDNIQFHSISCQILNNNNANIQVPFVISSPGNNVRFSKLFFYFIDMCFWLCCEAKKTI